MSANLILKLESAVESKLDVKYKEGQILIKMGVIFGTDLIKVATILRNSRACKSYYLSGKNNQVLIKILTK